MGPGKWRLDWGRSLKFGTVEILGFLPQNCVKIGLFWPILPLWHEGSGNADFNRNLLLFGVFLPFALRNTIIYKNIKECALQSQTIFFYDMKGLGTQIWIEFGCFLVYFCPLHCAKHKQPTVLRNAHCKARPIILYDMKGLGTQIWIEFWPFFRPFLALFWAIFGPFLGLGGVYPPPPCRGGSKKGGIFGAPGKFDIGIPTRICGDPGPPPGNSSKSPKFYDMKGFWTQFQ